MRDEGVIKFEGRWQKTAAFGAEELQDLIGCRNELYRRGLIGVYPDGIGYGNLSRRGNSSRRFLISGSQTGHLPQAGPQHFTLVTDYDVKRNRLECRGPVQASSESLTHAMIYEIFPTVQAIIHVHSAALWGKLKNHIPTTGAEIPYGTPQMALEIKRLAVETDLGKRGILAMAGHEDGIITFGADLESAWRVIKELF